MSQSIDDFIAQHRGKLKLAGLLALVFTLGFAFGYYYLAPDRSSSSLTVKESSESCQALFQEKTGGGQTASASAASSASAATSTSAAATGSSATAVTGLFAASKNSTLYHTRDCQFVKRIKAENLVWFASQEEAEAAGKQPHSCVGR